MAEPGFSETLIWFSKRFQTLRGICTINSHTAIEWGNHEKREPFHPGNEQVLFYLSAAISITSIPSICFYNRFPATIKIKLIHLLSIRQWKSASILCLQYISLIMCESEQNINSVDMIWLQYLSQFDTHKNEIMKIWHRSWPTVTHYSKAINVFNLWVKDLLVCETMLRYPRVEWKKKHGAFFLHSQSIEIACVYYLAGYCRWVIFSSHHHFAWVQLLPVNVVIFYLTHFIAQYDSNNNYTALIMLIMVVFWMVMLWLI